MKLSTPLKRAKGLGAGGGVHHWWMQRISAILLAIVVVFLVVSATQHDLTQYAAAREWVQTPLVALFLILFSIVSFYHAFLGIQSIAEDYIQHNGFKFFYIISKKLGCFILAVACVFAVLSIYFKG